jgi:hypothetical protein
MSDLAPFVATVLKDRAMVEMMTELETLKRLVDERLKVQITGKRGSPVYREGSLRDGYTSHRGRCFEVMFDDINDIDETETKTKTETANNNNNNNNKINDNQSPSGVLTLAALGDLEIRLGGSVIQRLDAHTVVGFCNAPFFTDDNFYRDNRYNKPQFLAHDRKEIIFKVKARKRGPVPFLIARFGNEMNFGDYHKLQQLDREALMELSRSGRVSTIILDGLTLSKPEILESLGVLRAMGYGVDEGNGHKHYVHAVDATRLPVRKSRP